MSALRASLVGLSLTFLAACQTTPAPVEDPRQVWCDHNEPLKLPAVAVATLSRAEREAFAARQLKGEAWCGWP